MQGLAIRVEGLGKRYRIGGASSSGVDSGAVSPRYQTLRERLGRLARSPLRAFGPAPEATPRLRELWALRGVSFEVERGECLGIIGRNGTGKSTLLKLLARVAEPSEGRACVWGSVGSLLEVGVGFHPELTGRDNIFLSGAILGMSRRDIARRFDEIVAFAEIGPLLDTPVKFYSSGMTVRLGFAVAAHLEPDILLADEVLAVGDAAFQRRCLGKMGAVAGEGRTVLFVSHQMDMVRALCDRALLLSGGRIVAEGSPAEVIERYLGEAAAGAGAPAFEVPDDAALRIQVTRGRLLGPGAPDCARFDVFDPIGIELDYAIREPIEGATVCLELRRNGSVLLQSFDADTDPSRLEERSPGRYRTSVQLPCPLLKPGRYTISIATGVINKGKTQYLEDALAFDVELLSRPSSLLSYAPNRPGVIAVPLDWRTARLGGTAGVAP